MFLEQQSAKNSPDRSELHPTSTYFGISMKPLRVAPKADQFFDDTVKVVYRYPAMIGVAKKCFCYYLLECLILFARKILENLFEYR